MSFRAMADRVFIKPDEAQERLGSIIIPETARERPKQGIVRYTGPGMLMANGNRWPMPVKPGERVIYADNDYPRVEIAGEKLIVVRDDMLLAVIENDR